MRQCGRDLLLPSILAACVSLPVQAADVVALERGALNAGLSGSVAPDGKEVSSQSTLALDLAPVKAAVSNTIQTDASLKPETRSSGTVVASLPLGSNLDAEVAVSASRALSRHSFATSGTQMSGKLSYRPLNEELGPANASAQFIRSEDRGTGEAAQAPLKKEQATLAFSLPLQAFGVSNAALQGNSTWRRSELRDPVTGQLRRASGEAPRMASLRLTKDLPRAGAKIGLSGELGTARNFYQISEITRLRTAPALGAFLSYAPGPLALDFKLDRLAGGTQQLSTSGAAGSTRKPRDTSFSVSLRKAL